MNTPNPLVPQGSLERQSKGKSTVRIAIFTIVSIHAVFFAGLLMQGCNRDEKNGLNKAANTDVASTNQNTLAPIDPGYYSGTQEVVQASNSVPPGVSGMGTGTTPPTAATEPSFTPQLPAVPEAASEGKSYKIVKGDTFAKIAKANGVSVHALTRANPNVEASHLKVGQSIQIPAATAGSPKLGFAEPGGSETATGTNVHVVKAGETLTKIAKQHGISVKALRMANHLKTDRLLVNQKLTIPSASTAGNSSESAKTSSVSKMTATNPVSPAGSNLQ